MELLVPCYLPCRHEKYPCSLNPCSFKNDAWKSINFINTVTYLKCFNNNWFPLPDLWSPALANLIPTYTDAGIPTEQITNRMTVNSHITSYRSFATVVASMLTCNFWTSDLFEQIQKPYISHTGRRWMICYFYSAGADFNNPDGSISEHSIQCNICSLLHLHNI